MNFYRIYKFDTTFWDFLVEYKNTYFVTLYYQNTPYYFTCTCISVMI